MIIIHNSRLLFAKMFLITANNIKSKSGNPAPSIHVLGKLQTTFVNIKSMHDWF